MPESPQSPKSSRNAELSSLFTFRITKVSTVTGRGGGRGRETQNCRHFLASSRLKSVNRHTDQGGRGRKTQSCRHFWTRLESSRLKSVNSHRGGRGRETQNCRHFWTCLGSSRLKSVNSHRDPGGSWSRNAELSSLLDSTRVSVSQKCQQSKGSGVVVAKPRPVVTFGLVLGLRVSKVSTVTRIRGVEVAKRRTVVSYFWTRLGSSRLKSVNRHTDQGGRGRENQNCRHF